MSQKTVVLIGAGLCLVGLLAYRSFGMLIFVGIATMFVGWQFVGKVSSTGAGISKPPIPTDFTATYWNKNIALDATTRRIWLRDRDGSTTVLMADQIVRCEPSSSSAQHQTNIGPQTVHLDTALRVTIRDIGKPLWTVPFNAHLTRTMGGSRANYEELQEWNARLGALITS